MKFATRPALPLLLCLLMAGFVAGCTSHKYASFGHPGAFVYRQSLGTVRLAVVEEFLNQKYELAESSGRRLVFEKKEGVGGFLMHGDWEGNPVYTRVTLEIVDEGDGQRLSASVQKVRNKDDWATEESSNSWAGGRSEVQKILDATQARFPASPADQH